MSPVKNESRISAVKSFFSNLHNKGILAINDRRFSLGYSYEILMVFPERARAV